jgi:hypothetical protein
MLVYTAAVFATGLLVGRGNWIGALAVIVACLGAAIVGAVAAEQENRHAGIWDVVHRYEMDDDEMFVPADWVGPYDQDTER